MAILKGIRLFFPIWVFFYKHSQITGLQGKGEGISLTPHYQFHPLHRHLDISRVVTAESSPLHIASSRTQNGREPLLSECKSLTTKLRALLLLYTSFKVLLKYFTLLLCLNIIYLIKMKVLTKTSYKEHCELYTEIHSFIAVNSYLIGLARKDIKLLLDTAVIGLARKDRHIKFTLSISTYSVDDFNTKIKAAALQQK